ncbi:MAG: IS110 family transposase, partial [Thermoanaerobaculia bacterium]
MTSVIAGVDCHAESHTIVVVDGVLGRRVGELVVRATEGFEAFRSARSEVEQLASAHGDGTVVWGLESTGSYGRHFAEFLVASGDIVYEVPPRVAHAERKRARRLGKSDELDAHAIAKVVLREGERLTRYYGARLEEELRLYYDHRDRLVRERTQLINRLRHAARRLGITDVPADLTSARGLERLSSTTATHPASSPIELAVRTELDFSLTRLRLLGEQIA